MIRPCAAPRACCPLGSTRLHLAAPGDRQGPAAADCTLFARNLCIKAEWNHNIQAAPRACCPARSAGGRRRSRRQALLGLVAHGLAAAMQAEVCASHCKWQSELSISKERSCTSGMLPSWERRSRPPASAALRRLPTSGSATSAALLLASGPARKDRR